jgi:glycosyltransferase 2 family protein
MKNPQFCMPAQKSSLLSKIVRLSLGTVLGTTFAYFLFKMVDLAQVRAILADATLIPLILALAIYAADFFLRAVRFWMLLNGVSPHPIPLKPTIAPFVASFGVSDVLPFRVGDVFRIYWFQQRFGIKVATLVGVMIVERVMDLLALVILGIVALRFIDGSRLSPLFGDFQLVLEAALIVLMVVILSPGFFSRLLARMRHASRIAAIARVIGFLEATLVAMHQSGSWRKIVFNVCFSVMIWILESCVLLAVWFSLGGNLSNWYPPVFAFVASSLATILPGLPGHFGSFEYFGVQAFLASGVSAEQAAAVLFLAHLILWAPTAIFAVVWLLAVRRGKDKTDKDKLATTSS